MSAVLDIKVGSTKDWAIWLTRTQLIYLAEREANKVKQLEREIRRLKRQKRIK